VGGTQGSVKRTNEKAVVPRCPLMLAIFRVPIITDFDLVETPALRRSLASGYRRRLDLEVTPSPATLRNYVVADQHDKLVNDTRLGLDRLAASLGKLGPTDWASYCRTDGQFRRPWRISHSGISGS
jgi:hypothetical protein